MRITEILDEEIESSFKILQTECSKFFLESGGLPLYKTLPPDYDDFHRVKVRHGKRNDSFSTTLNLAFESKRTQFSQRAIFASGNPPNDITESSFYIFPINGFGFLYNTVITENNNHNLHAFDSIYERFGHEEGNKLIADILQFSYIPQHLNEGLQNGAEVIIYGIPAYYAMRISSVDGYDDVLTSVLNIV